MSISSHNDKRIFYSYILLSGEKVAEEITAKLKEPEKQKKEDKKVSSGLSYSKSVFIDVQRNY